jgi:hypothetical protein
MKIPQALPITAEQSRAARFHLGLSQSEVIKQSDLPGHKLKNFETGRFVPDMAFLQKLNDFYSGLGVDLSGDANLSTQHDQPEIPITTKPGSAMVRQVQRPCFYVSEDVTQDLLDQCLERMHENDERNAQILKKAIANGMFGYDEETAQEHQELFGAMSENYLIFRLLQGNPLVQPNDSNADPKTHADLLGQFYAKSPLIAPKELKEGVAQ